MNETQRRAAYEGWVRAYSVELFRCAYRLTGRHQTAEDLVQETFVEAWRGAAKLGDENKARAWLFQILRYRHLHRLRDKKRRMEGQPGRVPLPGDIQAQEQRPEFEEQDAMNVALSGLNEALRETFVLVVMGGLTTREAAEQMRVPPGTILSRLHRAREQLREMLVDARPDKRSVE